MRDGQSVKIETERNATHCMVCFGSVVVKALSAISASPL